ncbi:MAG: hypothetical protein KC549_03210, partial [Myxococcales bacterium]|nr:hypothetical protein [Myxococcales bacterium]
LGATTGTPRRAGADLLVVRDRTRDATGWRGVSVDGRTLWLDNRPAAAWQLMGGGLVTVDAQGHADVALRYDQVRDLATLVPDPTCQWDREEADLRVPLAACPQAAPTARVITALDAETGQCRWRMALRPARCGNPSNQNISLADGDGDGVAEVYVTATNELIRLDPTDGQVLERVEIGFIGASGRGGGLMLTGPPLIRYAGNGPPDAWDPDLGLLWRAALPEGGRGQSWQARPALIVDQELWASAGPGDPIHRYALDAQGEDVAPTATIGLAGGALADDGLVDVHGIQPVAGALRDGSDGVLVTGDDGWLYALARDARLAWSRRFPAVIGPVVVQDLDGDGDRELAVPLNDGRVQIADLPGPPAPSARWDLPCPPVPTCDPEADIDEVRLTTALCGEWYPVEQVTGYEVRVVDANGAVIRDFQDVGAATIAQIDGLALVPGARYALEIRSRWAVGGTVRRGQPGATDGVVVVNDEAPTVELEAAPDRLAAGGRVRLTVRAHDDDLLAGWALVVTTADGDLVQRLAGGPLAQADFMTDRDWNTDDRQKAPVPPGRYRVEASVIDRGRNAAQAIADIEVCDGPCP